MPRPGRSGNRLPEPSQTTFVAGTAAAAALSAAVAGAGITREPLWEDELVSVALVGRSLGGMLVRLPEEHHGILFDLALWPVVQLGGTSSLWLRLPSLLAVVGAVVLTALVGARLAGRAAGLGGAGLLALHPLAVRYAQEARMYALALLAGVLAVWLLLRALERPTARRWALYALGVAALGYAHDFALLTLVAHPLLVRSRPPGSWRPFLASLAGAAALLIPLVPLALSDFSNDGRDWIGEPGLGTLKEVGYALVGSRVAKGVTVILLAAAALAYVRSRSPRRPSPDAVAFLAAWALAPFAALFLVSFAKPALVPRYLIPSLPAVCIGLAAAAALLGRRGALAATAAVAALFALATVDATRDVSNPDWPGAAAHLDARRADGEPEILMGWAEGTGNMLGYYQRDLGRDRGRLPWIDDGLPPPLTTVSLRGDESALARAVGRGPAWFVVGIVNEPHALQERFRAWTRTCRRHDTTWRTYGIELIRVAGCPTGDGRRPPAPSATERSTEVAMGAAGLEPATQGL